MADEREIEERLADELRTLGEGVDPAPVSTEQAVIAAFRRRHERPVSPWRWAAAAVVLVALGAAAWFQLRPSAPFPEAEPELALERSTEFFVLDPVGPGIFDGRGRLVRITLPPGEGFAGLPVPTDAAGAAMKADVLLGDDGFPHAVRFVY